MTLWTEADSRERERQYQELLQPHADTDPLDPCAPPLPELAVPDVPMYDAGPYASLSNLDPNESEAPCRECGRGLLCYPNTASPICYPCLRIENP